MPVHNRFVPRCSIRQYPTGPAGPRQSIDIPPLRLTIPIATANSAVQSNEVYLTPCSTVPSLQLRLGVR